MNSALSYRHGRPENEASRRLYRGAGETAQRLEQSLNHVSSFGNLFSPELTELRTRLKDYCERLMFTDPVEYGRKAEDLLWRKVYYEFFQKCKQNKKKLVDSEYFQHTLKCHLLAALGSYHHILLRIQTEFYLDLNGKADVPFMWQMKGVKKERWKKYQQSAVAESAVQAWASQACHRILTYLGDLARYVAELEPELQPEPENIHLAERYYLQAFCYNIRNGTPHNQLGSLADNQFDSAYHYMRCLSSSEKFEAAEGNLIRIFEKNNQNLQEIESADENSKEFTHPSRFLIRFLKLCEVFHFGCEENIQSYCQNVLQDFDSCMPTNDKFVTCAEDDVSPVSLKEKVVFEVSVMCMIGITKLHEKESPDVSTATAFVFALFSSIVHYTTLDLLSAVYEAAPDETEAQTIKIENEKPSIINEEPTSEDGDVLDEDTNETDRLQNMKKHSGKKMAVRKFKSSGIRKLRRRRKISNTSQEDSELSDVEILELAESDEENGLMNSEASQNGSCSSDSLSEREEGDLVETINLENKNKSSIDNSNNDVFIDAAEVIEKPKKDFILDLKNKKLPSTIIKCSDLLLPIDQLFQALKTNDLLPSLKVLMDWLKINKELMTLFADNLNFFFCRLIELFNLLLKLEEQLLKDEEPMLYLQRSGKEWLQSVPLPEDILLQGLPALENLHNQLSFSLQKRRELSTNQQAFYRVQCLLSFGDLISDEFSNLIIFDKEKRLYSLKSSHNRKSKTRHIKNFKKNKESNNDTGNQKQQLMHDMAHLWLKAEVNNLEKSIQNSGNPQLSPLLITDTSVLCHHLVLLKQLVAAKCFVVIVPNIVIDNLDLVKKKSPGAREAIRWLEYVFQKGNRHIRAQRDNERSPVNPIKYPKRKDKESWDFFQILECCHFHVQQQSAGKSSCSLVTLLIGTSNELPSNAGALARSLSISMENLESFFAKWRASKKPG